MVAANPKLLKIVRRLAVRDEMQAMKLRGRLVVPLVPQAAKRPAGNG